MWAQYIDGILLLCDCPLHTRQIYTYDMGIKLEHEASHNKIHFLDLKMTQDGFNLITSTFFKATECNAFILTDNCHPPWLKSIPVAILLES